MSDPNQALVLTEDIRAVSVTGFSEQAIADKEDALAASGLIGKVQSADQNAIAVAAVVRIHDLLKVVDEAYEAYVLAPRRKAMKMFKEYRDALDDDELRLNTLIGNYQAIESARLRDAMIAVQNEASSIEHRRHLELSKCTTDDARDSVNEMFDEEARRLKVPIPVRAEGQVVKEDWEIQIENLDLLYACARQCVELKPKLGEIRKLLDMGLTVQGVKATKVTKSSVRTKAKASIDV